MYELDDLSTRYLKSSKKLYTAMKISRLGSLADITQRSRGGRYTDGGARANMMRRRAGMG